MKLPQEVFMYVGIRPKVDNQVGGTRVVRVGSDGVKELPWRLDLVNHSPTGFEWGYGGSGPAQLALALLADATGDDDYARAKHQRFKFNVVGRLPHDDWVIPLVDILGWVRQHPLGLALPQEDRDGD